MLIRFYELWRNDSDLKFQLNPFAGIVKSFFTGRNNICEYSAISCYRILGIDSKGDVYVCSRSTHIPETFMGNINNQGLDELLESEPHKAILDRYLRLKESGCKYFSICSGGCPIEALSYKGDFMENSYYCCETKRGLYELIEEDLKDDNTRRRLETKLSL